MAQENFWIDLVATLKKAQSKKQVQSDAKNLGEIKVPLIGTLSKAKTKAQLKQDLASLNGTINLTESLSIDNLDSVQNVFGDLDMFDEWVRKVTDAKTSTEDLQQAFDDLATEYLNTSEIFQSYLLFEHRIYVIDLPNFFEKIFLKMKITASMLIKYIIDFTHKNRMSGGSYIDSFKSRYRLGSYECA